MSKAARQESDKTSLGNIATVFVVTSQDIVYRVMQAIHKYVHGGTSQEQLHANGSWVWKSACCHGKLREHL